MAHISSTHGRWLRTVIITTAGIGIVLPWIIGFTSFSGPLVDNSMAISIVLGAISVMVSVVAKQYRWIPLGLLSMMAPFLTVLLVTVFYGFTR
ncbi:hypothetical protein M0E87_00760 [Corynebacterium sp. CCM 9185]|uniref:Cyd operon protein YbgE n=1 Tax=Corynebacterium marambiense TaxID=2765364 RepID=A0ABS0W2A7_9CORY|nr:hypothetical protein [Corynebacterium marambiense]MBI9001737.1 hypothetical protein [Corynebacterium marambiense]MCK7662201.1 hypothetical protein [Corynebacterium marambiense]MCX7541471.1 hypothetical protein [Corynebacterium marambiense]